MLDSKRRELGGLPTQLACCELEIVLREEGNVPTAVAERRDLDWEHVESIEEILAEASLGHLLLQVTVRRGDHADVNLACPLLANPFVLTLLEDAEELRLHVERDLADLVQEEGPLVSELEPTGPVSHRPGESSLHVTEKLAFKEFPRDGRAVHFDEWLFLPAAMGVHGARDELFPRPRLTIHDDVRLRRRHRRDSLEHVPEARGRTDDLVEVVLCPDLLPEVNVLRLEPLFQSRHFHESPP